MRRRFKALVVVPAARLGVIHRQVGTLEQHAGIGFTFGKRGNADAGRDVHQLLQDRMRRDCSRTAFTSRNTMTAPLTCPSE